MPSSVGPSPLKAALRPHEIRRQRKSIVNRSGSNLARSRIMAILQAVLALIGRSLGRITSAIFGWAVVALFGQTSPTERTLLSAVVGAAALWPVLLFGVAVPKVAAFVLAFAHLPG